jgi:hypothetical protein
MPVLAQAPRALRVTGTIERTECVQHGIELCPVRPRLRFEAEIDELGRWGITGAYPRRPATAPADFEIDKDGRVTVPPPTQSVAERYEHGFDGANTYVVHRSSEDLMFVDRSLKPIEPQPEETLANIFRGDEFPFRAGAWSHLDWFVLASFGSQQRPEKVGHVPSLLGRDRSSLQESDISMTDISLDADPLAHALKVRSTYRAEWPRFVERAEFFLDPSGTPRQPIGLMIPTDASSAKVVDSRWKSLQTKSPAARVGRLTSGEPKTFNGRVYATRYRLEMTWRFSSRPVDPSRLENPMARMELRIEHVQELADGVGRPRLPVTQVKVSDYRFRRVADDSVTEFLGYWVDDGRWKSEHEFGLRVWAALKHFQGPGIVRVGNPADSLH